MTSQTSTALLKSQLNLDHDLDDALLDHKLAAAEIWIANHTGLEFDSTNAAQTEAALQLASYWYSQREAASFEGAKVVPFGVRELLASFREGVVGYNAE